MLLLSMLESLLGIRRSLGKWGLAGLLLGVSGSLYSCGEQQKEAVVQAGCVRDTDCKGERVCVDGECVSEGGERDSGYTDTGIAGKDAGFSLDVGTPFFDAGISYIDNDQDGFYGTENPETAVDCDDNNASINPSAREICDYLDNNCDAETDEGLRKTFWVDRDEDGYGDTHEGYTLCNAGDLADQIDVSLVDNELDCDDEDRSVNPEARELCDDIDNNCNEAEDEDCSCIESEEKQCGNSNIGECQYGTQICGINGEWSECQGALFPHDEECDGVDNDCDNQVDEGVKLTFYQDSDGDGFGNVNVTRQACAAPAGFVRDSTDCDDNDRNLWQLLQGYSDADGDGFGIGNQQNVCSGNALPAGYANRAGDCRDNDRAIWQLLVGYTDADGDGFGIGNQQNVCSGNALPAGYAGRAGDCRDNDRAIWQLLVGYTDADGDGFGIGNQQNVCSGNALPAGFANRAGDCNDGNAGLWQNLPGYRDADGDGFGAGNQQNVCSGNALPAGYANRAGDCGGDNNRNINPNAAEVCDGVDNDCDRVIDLNTLCGRIAFSSDRNGAYQIHIINADGSGLRRLTNRAGNEISPSFSGDGTRIAFATDIDAGDYNIGDCRSSDGGNCRIFGNTLGYDGTPSFSPLNDWVVFMSVRDDNYEIYKIQINVGSVRLTRTEDNSEDSPVWSPDGTKIIYTREGELYTMNPDGNNQVALLDNHFNEYDPTWLADGSKIAFISERDGNPELYIADSDGSNLERLTFTNNQTERNPSFSPYGGKIVFQRGSRWGGQLDDLYVLNINDGEESILVNNANEDEDPSWGLR